jgi:chromosome segregation ATPase
MKLTLKLYLTTGVIGVIIAITVFSTFLITKTLINKSLEEQIQQLSNEKTSLQTELNSLQTECSQKESNIIDFLREYSVVLNNIYTAQKYSKFAHWNYQAWTAYTTQEGWVYSTAKVYTTTGQGEINDAKDLLNKALTKLMVIKNKAPNKFYSKEIENRIFQVEQELIVCDNIYNLLDYSDKNLYESYYGTPKKADEYSKKLDEAIAEYSTNIKSTNFINEEIDNYWVQNWYKRIIS